MASQSENDSSLLGTACLNSLNLCCLFFRLSFSFSLARACICWVPALAHRVCVTAGARKRGIDEAAGRVAVDRLSLAIEARQCLAVAMVEGGGGASASSLLQSCQAHSGCVLGLQNFWSSGLREAEGREVRLGHRLRLELSGVEHWASVGPLAIRVIGLIAAP